MSESSFYECCQNYGTHTAQCNRKARAISHESLSVLTKASESISDPIDRNLTASRLGLTRLDLPPEDQG